MADAWVSGRVRVVAAQIAGKSSGMDAAAENGLQIARRLAAQHRDTGNYIANLKVVEVPGEKGTGRTVRDRLVVADDVAAASIEWGHLVRYKNARRVRWVPGQRILTRTKGLM